MSNRQDSKRSRKDKFLYERSGIRGERTSYPSSRQSARPTDRDRLYRTLPERPYTIPTLNTTPIDQTPIRNDLINTNSNPNQKELQTVDELSNTKDRSFDWYGRLKGLSKDAAVAAAVLGLTYAMSGDAQTRFKNAIRQQPIMSLQKQLENEMEYKSGFDEEDFHPSQTQDLPDIPEQVSIDAGVVLHKYTDGTGFKMKLVPKEL